MKFVDVVIRDQELSNPFVGAAQRVVALEAADAEGEYMSIDVLRAKVGGLSRSSPHVASVAGKE